VYVYEITLYHSKKDTPEFPRNSATSQPIHLDAPVASEGLHKCYPTIERKRCVNALKYNASVNVTH
jgi:hypothetical protein